MGTTQAGRQSQPVHYDVADADDLYSVRMPNSARRYKAADKGVNPLSTDDSTIGRGPFIRRRASRAPQGVASTAVSPSLQTQRTEQAHTRRRTAVMLMLGAVAALLLIMLTNALFSWWQGVMDNIHYGYPRTSQLDAVVGHNDSATNQTHFIFLNLHGHIEIIEIPGGDTSHARIFTGPTLIGAGQDLIPVTGEIRNEDGRLDLIVHIQNQQIVFINDGSTFHQQ
jgi:hypothetical protein